MKRHIKTFKPKSVNDLILPGTPFLTDALYSCRCAHLDTVVSLTYQTYVFGINPDYPHDDWI